MKCGKVGMIVTMRTAWPCALDKLSTFNSVLMMCLLISCVLAPLANGHLTFSPSGKLFSISFIRYIVTLLH